MGGKICSHNLAVDLKTAWYNDPNPANKVYAKTILPGRAVSISSDAAPAGRIVHAAETHGPGPSPEINSPAFPDASYTMEKGRI